MDVLTSLILLVFFLVLLLAFAFTLVGLPGNWLMMVAIALVGMVTKGEILSLWQCISLVGILLLGELVEFLLPLLGVKKYKPSFWAYVASALGAVLGGIAGTAILPFIGGFLGSALGVFVLTYCVEYVYTRNSEAKMIARSAMIASLVGMTIKFSLAIGVLSYLFVYMVSSLIGWG